MHCVMIVYFMIYASGIAQIATLAWYTTANMFFAKYHLWLLSLLLGLNKSVI